MCDAEAISALIDGELPESNAADLLSHMETCPSCRALHDDFLAMRDGFEAIAIDPPDTLAPGIRYKVELGGDPPRSRRIIGSLIGVAACLIAALFISHFSALPQSANNEPMYDSAAPGAGTDYGIMNGTAGRSGAQDSSDFSAASEGYDTPSIVPEYRAFEYAEDGASEPESAPVADEKLTLTDSAGSVLQTPEPSEEPSPSEVEAEPEPTSESLE